jgi:HNH endonuclease
VEEKLLKRIEIAEDGCWLWTGATNESGYGYVWAGGRRWRAHRLAYSLFVSDLPEGMEIDHLCRNRGCVNPDHLEAVDHRTNCLRGRNAQSEKTHCRNGHEYTPENTYVYQGERSCRTCGRDRCRRWYVRQKVS